MTDDVTPKIIHIASGDLWAGAEVQLFTLVSTMQKKMNWPTTIILLNHGRLQQELETIGLNVIVLDETKLNSMQILWQLLRIIRRQKPDVIHTHRNKENVLGSLAALLAGGIPCLRTIHGAPEHPVKPWQIVKRLNWSLDKLCGQFLQKKVIAVSSELAENLRRSYDQKKITVIENGINIDITRSACPDRLRYENKSGDPFKIGLAGRLTAVKRVDLAIMTAAWLRKNYPAIKAEFYIYGDGPLRQELELLSQTLDTAEIVRFLGHVDHIHKKLCELDALLLTSDHEGLPMIALEAMAIGVPVIAHATGGIPQLLDNGNCGYLVNNQDAANYAESISFLATHRNDAKQKVAAAYSRIDSYYSASTNARKYAELYISLAG